jgi:hypothetical protein
MATARPVITNRFPKQPREIRWFTITFADLLLAYADTPRAIAPIEFDTIPAGIAIDEQLFTPATGLLDLLISGGTDLTDYLLTVWLHTVSGQRIEHQVTVRVKELLK